MIANMTSEKALPKATVDEIINRTDGIPLFIEELTKVLVERGDAGGSMHEIPATLHDMLMARLDRLEGAQRGCADRLGYRQRVFLEIAARGRSDRGRNASSGAEEACR
jgi:hypothetical protein